MQGTAKMAALPRHHLAGSFLDLIMKVTLNLRKATIARTKREAASRGCTVSELVEMALRAMFASNKKPLKQSLKLPRFSSGGHLVDIADRDSLYDVMDDLSLYRRN